MRRLLFLGIYAVFIAAVIVISFSARASVDNSGQSLSTSSASSTVDIKPAKVTYINLYHLNELSSENLTVDQLNSLCVSKGGTAKSGLNECNGSLCLGIGSVNDGTIVIAFAFP